MNMWDEAEEHQILTASAKRPMEAKSQDQEPPSVQDLHRLIIGSKDCLFFVAFPLPGSDAKEWNLVRVAYDASLSANLNCLSDGRFLVDFYILHPEDKAYNATNQRYWLEYHKKETILLAEHATTYHLLRPSAESEIPKMGLFGKPRDLHSWTIQLCRAIRRQTISGQNCTARLGNSPCSQRQIFQ